MELTWGWTWFALDYSEPWLMVSVDLIIVDAATALSKSRWAFAISPLQSPFHRFFEEPLTMYGPTGPHFQRCSTFMTGAPSSEEAGLLCTELLKFCPPLSQCEQALSSLGNLVLIYEPKRELSSQKYVSVSGYGAIENLPSLCFRINSGLIGMLLRQ